MSKRDRTIKIAPVPKHIPCSQCGTTMTVKRENHPFVGLPGTTLIDVPVRRCPACGAYEVTYPDFDQLVQTLARDVVAKEGRLTGAEIRFLRSVLDRTSQDFAALLGASAVTVSRWEHDAQPISVHADMLLRAVVLLWLGGATATELAQLAKANAKPKATKRVRAVKHSKRQWERTQLKAA